MPPSTTDHYGHVLNISERSTPRGSGGRDALPLRSMLLQASLVPTDPAQSSYRPAVFVPSILRGPYRRRLCWLHNISGNGLCQGSYGSFEDLQGSGRTSRAGSLADVPNEGAFDQSRGKHDSFLSQTSRGLNLLQEQSDSDLPHQLGALVYRRQERVQKAHQRYVTAP